MLQRFCRIEGGGTEQLQASVWQGDVLRLGEPFERKVEADQSSGRVTDIQFRMRVERIMQHGPQAELGVGGRLLGGSCQAQGEGKQTGEQTGHETRRLLNLLRGEPAE